MKTTKITSKTIPKKKNIKINGGYVPEQRFYSAAFTLLSSIIKDHVCNSRKTVLSTNTSFINQFNTLYQLFRSIMFLELNSKFNCVLSKLYTTWDTFTKLSFLGVLYLARFKSVDDSVLLKNNSANCDFAIFKVKTLFNTDRKYFIKFVSYPWVGDDDIIINDCLHGKLLNKLLLQYPEFKDHFMIFNESFLTFTTKSSPKNWSIKDIMKLSDKYPSFISEKKYAAVFDNINGHSLSDLHLDIYSKKLYDYVFYVDFPIFYDAFEELGLKHGLIHNDLHLGNIYFNSDTQHLMMIDYGRMSIGSKLYQQNDANNILRSEMTRLNMTYLKNSEINRSYNNKTITYKEFIQATNNYLHSDITSSYDQGVYYPLHIMDMITLCANLYITNLQRKDNKPITMNFLTISGDIKNREKIQFTVYKSTDLLFGLYIQSYDKILDELSSWRQKSSLIILEGMMYFSAFLLFIKDKGDDTKPQTRDKITYTFNDIDDFFWLYFQYIGSQNDARRFLKYLFNSVANYKKNEILVRKTRILKKLSNSKYNKKIQIAGVSKMDDREDISNSDKNMQISNENLDEAFAKNRDKKYRAPVKRANITISDEPNESDLVCPITDDITILKPFLATYDGGKSYKKTSK